MELNLPTNNIRTLVVGGTFGTTAKKSSIIDKISKKMEATVFNGGSYETLKTIDLTNFDLILWYPNIENKFNKYYPKKPIGSVMIISKNLYTNNNRTRADAVSRIFDFHANAVVAITKQNRFKFQLIDALNNDWCNTENLDEVVSAIFKLYKWTKDSKRKPTVRTYDDLDRLMKLVRNTAIDTKEVQGRFFGNVSTRCSKLFPTLRIADDVFMVSKRNCDKEFIEREDMVELGVYDSNKGLMLKYKGKNKPSVDSPIQVCIYKAFPYINFMIHGHNFIEGAEYTEEYFPCGDLREVAPICDLIEKSDNNYGIINLKNHGFLLYSDSIEMLEELQQNMKICEMTKDL
jgi:hypothetical protein